MALTFSQAVTELTLLKRRFPWDQPIVGIEQFGFGSNETTLKKALGKIHQAMTGFAVNPNNGNPLPAFDPTDVIQAGGNTLAGFSEAPDPENEGGIIIVAIAE